jgi:hypothetical protein
LTLATGFATVLGVADTVYLVAWADGLSGFDTHEAIDRAYLTREEAEAEVERFAQIVARSRADGNIGIADGGLEILAIPLGGEVEIDQGLYLAKYA